MRRVAFVTGVAVCVLLAETLLGHAQDYNIRVDMSNTEWSVPRIAFDYTNSNGATNCVSLLGFDHDGKIRFFRSEGGGHDLVELADNSFPATIGVCDSLGWFYNNLVIEFDSLGTEITFDIHIDPTTAGTAGRIDELAFYVLGRYDLNPFQTADPSGANALFALSLNDDETVDLTVFDPMIVTGDSLSLTLDSTVVGISRVSVVDDRLRFLTVSPNPTRRNIQISYLVPSPGSRVRGHIYDFQGRLVRVLFDNRQSPGEGEVTWNGADDAGRSVASGVYFLRLTTAGQSVTRKVVLVR